MARMPVLPTGTVTFLFTDLERSTRLWEEFPEAMKDAVAAHDRIVRGAIESRDGHVFSTGGDAFAAAFSRPGDAMVSAVEIQRGLDGHDWPPGCELRARIGIHSGTADERDGDYFGPTVNRAARLMSAGHGGQVLVSLVTEEMAREQLPAGLVLQDLGRHRLRDLSQAEHVFQVGDGEFPSLRTLDAVPNNLPVQRSSFVGRTEELARLSDLLAEHRLVTLTGVGGTGKTRLALELAASVSQQFPDGAFVVEAAPISDPSDIVTRVAASIGMSQGGEDRLDTGDLVAFLVQRRFLLVLDNCEHLIDACADLVDDLLAGCPDLTVLATSREALEVEGERSWRVPSLGLSDDGREDEAVRLFVDRAAAARSDFVPNADDIETVAEICRRLDGIPLAIELAAARVRHLSVAQITDRLDDRFRLLTGGRRRARQRQQTLEATLDWSHDLLSETEKILFRRISVFVGTFSLDAVDGICADEVTGPPLDVLASLVDKSLVTTQEDSDMVRYRLLETVRMYAQERLVDAGEAEEIRERHRDWFLDRLETSAVDIDHRFRSRHVKETKADFGNILATLEWSEEEGRLDLVARSTAAVHAFWWMFARFAEAERWLSAGEPAFDELTAEQQVRWLTTKTFIGMVRSDARHMVDCANRAIALDRARQSTFLPFAYVTLAEVALWSDTDEALRNLEEARRCPATLVSRAMAGWIDSMEGVARLVAGDFEGTIAVTEQALEELVDGDQMFRPLTSLSLAHALHFSGDQHGALEAAASARASMPEFVQWASHLLWFGAEALPRAALGEIREAADLLRTQLDVARRDYPHVPQHEAIAVNGIAGVATIAGQYERAARLLVAIGSRFFYRSEWSYATARHYAQVCHEALGEEMFQRCMDEVAVSSDVEIVAAAEEILDAL